MSDCLWRILSAGCIDSEENLVVRILAVCDIFVLATRAGLAFAVCQKWLLELNIQSGICYRVKLTVA